MSSTVLGSSHASPKSDGPPTAQETVETSKPGCLKPAVLAAAQRPLWTEWATPPAGCQRTRSATPGGLGNSSSARYGSVVAAARGTGPGRLGQGTLGRGGGLQKPARDVFDVRDKT